jgi:hypothetical protein
MDLARVWVLDTETKGTGAEMVPLDKLQQRSATKGRRPSKSGKPTPPPAPPPPPRRPRRFKVMDVMSRRVLVEDADARGALQALRGIRSVVDVSIYVWAHDEDEWRPLTLAEKKLMWSFRPVADVGRSRRDDGTRLRSGSN